MAVRKVVASDLEEIAKVHMMCFPDSFSTQLGIKILKKFYMEYLNANPDLFLAGEKNGQIVGFCMGYLCGQRNIMDTFLQKNRMAVTLRALKLLFTGNRLIWKKIKKKFIKQEAWIILDGAIHKIPNEEKGDLLSICVLNNFRGTGIAQELIEQYERTVAAKGQTVCLLTVDPQNKRAVHFYERNGFRLYRSMTESCTYAKLLR